LFLPMMIITVLVAVGGLLVFKPKERISKEVADSIKKQPLPKMNRHEITSAIILGGVFVMFATSNFHGLPDVAVCLAAVFAFFLLGVLDSKDFSAGINWDLVIFIGMAISLGAIFTDTGISGWLAGIVVPALAPVAGNPWLFMFSVMIFMFFWRFFDVAIFIPTMAIIIPIIPDIYEAYNISPLVWLSFFVIAHHTFFMAYQNIWAMMSKSMVGEESWSNKHLATYGCVYFVASMIAVAVAVPVWINAGLFGVL